jgi:malic enzyme
VFDPRVCDAVARAVAAAAAEEGIARRGPAVSEVEGMEAPV